MVNAHYQQAVRLTEITVLFLSIGLVYISWTRTKNFKSFSLLTVYVKRLRRFSLHCMSFASSRKHHNRSNSHLKSESITGQPAWKLVVMRKLPGSSRTFFLVLRKKVFAKTILEHYSQTMFTKTVRTLRTGLTRKLWCWLPTPPWILRLTHFTHLLRREPPSSYIIPKMALPWSPPQLNTKSMIITVATQEEQTMTANIDVLTLPCRARPEENGKQTTVWTINVVSKALYSCNKVHCLRSTRECRGSLLRG